MTVTPVKPVPTARDRIRAALGKRQHVEQLTLILVIVIIQALVEVHAYTALSLTTVVTVGMRDLVLILLFAEEVVFDE